LRAVGKLRLPFDFAQGTGCYQKLQLNRSDVS
jgi:hypothetical protein